jgi:hypothetical protein
MYLCYIDESGDVGLVNSPTHFYCLTALIVHEDCWQNNFNTIKTLRAALRKEYSIKLDEELHATEIVAGQGISFKHKLDIDQRIDVFSQAIECIGKLENIKAFSVCIRKDELQKRDFDVLEFAWTLLSTRIHYTINRLNGITKKRDKTILIPDESQDMKIRKLLRKLRVFNPIWSDKKIDNVRLDSIIEDPLFSATKHSYFLQMCDMAAYVSVAKSVKIKKFEPYKFDQLFQMLDGILEKPVTKDNAEAIVYFPKIKNPAQGGV